MNKVENLSIKTEVRQYKNFTFKKNMLEISVAFMVSTAFNKVITAFSENLIMPIVNFASNSTVDWRKLELTPCNNLNFEIGKFLGSTVDFVLFSICFYLVYMKIVIPFCSKFAPDENNEKICIACCQSINKNATRCPFCTTRTH